MLHADAEMPPAPSELLAHRGLELAVRQLRLLLHRTLQARSGSAEHTLAVASRDGQRPSWWQREVDPWEPCRQSAAAHCAGWSGLA